MRLRILVHTVLITALWTAGCSNTNSRVGDVGGGGSGDAVGGDGADGTEGNHGGDGTDGVEGSDGADGTSGAPGTDGTDATEPPCDPPCGQGLACVAGECIKPQICQPDAWSCHGLTHHKQCNTDGTAFLEPVACPGDQYCTSGQCGLKCNLDPKWGAFVGCVFWTVDLPVWDDPTLPNANTLPHAVVISNPSELEATVSFTKPPGVNVPLPNVTVPGLGSEVVQFPSLDTSGSNIYDLGIRLESDRPVLVHQFNPWDNTYSNDASLLLPEPLLGTEYLVLSWPTDARSLIEIPGLPNFGGPSAHSFLSVVAPSDNTEVIVRTTARVNATEMPEGQDPATWTPPVKTLPKGGTRVFTLNKGQVLNLDAMPESIFETADLTGTLILSDKPVAVFSGHDSAAIAAPTPANPFPGGPDEEDDTSCCLDHLEEQMIPVPLLGATYLAAKSPSRGGEKDLWRVVAGADNVTITTTPAIDGLNGQTLKKKGDWIEAWTDQSFVINATGRVLVGQYLVGQAGTDKFTGDPSLILAIPIERFRATYPVMVPSSYSTNYITVVRKPGTSISVDGTAVPDGQFTAIAGGAWEMAWLSLDHGFHTITGSEPFGLSAYGYDSAASYGYPGGMTIPGESNP